MSLKALRPAYSPGCIHRVPRLGLLLWIPGRAAESVGRALWVILETALLPSGEGKMSVATCPVTAPKREEKWAVGMSVPNSSRV